MPRSRIGSGLCAVLLAVALGIGLEPGSALANGDRTERVVVRPEGARGQLVAYDPVAGAARVRLPAGMLSADGSRFYAATPAGGSTRIDAFDPGTGERLRRDEHAGAWAIDGVSPTGRWVALRRQVDDIERRAWIAESRWQTDLVILDGDDGRVAETIGLAGNFEVETISAGGDALFLVERLPAVDPDRYLVRLYDLGAGGLQEGALRDKRFFDEIMTGLAWDGVGTADGRWLLTLYVNTGRDTAFVHTLNLEERYAVCLDLPSGTGDPALLAAYALTLSPDGRRAYATNPALGVVAEVDLATRAVTRTTTFPPVAPVGDGSPPARGVVAPDGGTLYFTDGRGVWSYDTEAARVERMHAFAASVVGLGLTADGARLFAAGADGPLGVVDTASGALIGVPADAA